MSNKSKSLQQNDVISFLGNEYKLGLNFNTCKVKEFTNYILKRLSINQEIIEKWTNKGIESEVLLGSKGWCKGKVRLIIEFCPDEMEEEEIIEKEQPKTQKPAQDLDAILNELRQTIETKQKGNEE